MAYYTYLPSLIYIYCYVIKIKKAGILKRAKNKQKVVCYFYRLIWCYFATRFLVWSFNDISWKMEVLKENFDHSFVFMQHFHTVREATVWRKKVHPHCHGFDGAASEEAKTVRPAATAINSRATATGASDECECTYYNPIAGRNCPKAEKSRGDCQFLRVLQAS